jgi:hypothetical protein
VAVSGAIRKGIMRERAPYYFLAENAKIVGGWGRENTGNSPDFGWFAVGFGPNKPCLLSGFCRNSLLNRTGKYFGGTGNFFDITGNFQGGAGKPIWPPARRETPVFSARTDFEQGQLVHSGLLAIIIRSRQ